MNRDVWGFDDGDWSEKEAVGYGTVSRASWFYEGKTMRVIGD